MLSQRIHTMISKARSRLGSCIVELFFEICFSLNHVSFPQLNERELQILPHFFLAVGIIGFAASEFAVADIFTFSFFGFLDSLFPRLLLPLPIMCSSFVQRSSLRMATIIH
jgi:hypothetical protein